MLLLRYTNEATDIILKLGHNWTYQIISYARIPIFPFDQISMNEVSKKMHLTLKKNQSYDKIGYWKLSENINLWDTLDVISLLIVCIFLDFPSVDNGYTLYEKSCTHANECESLRMKLTNQTFMNRSALGISIHVIFVWCVNVYLSSSVHRFYVYVYFSNVLATERNATKVNFSRFLLVFSFFISPHMVPWLL